MALSISDLNVAKSCEETYEFEYLDANGNGTGVFLSVIGAHAPEIQKWQNKKLNERRRRLALQAKRGIKDEITTAEDDIEFGKEYIAMRIKSWRGITEPCTLENSMLLCDINPLIVDQVREASESMANFTKSK